ATPRRRSRPTTSGGSGPRWWGARCESWWSCPAARSGPTGSVADGSGAPLGRGAPVDLDVGHLVGVLLQPAAGERAPGGQDLAGAAGPLDGRPHQPAAQAAPAQLVGHARVGEGEAPGLGPVGQL